MLVSMIAALSENGIIGRDNKLPWNYPEDLQYFKRMTLNKPIVMGRKTYESIGHPLPNRHNIIVSREWKGTLPGCTVTHSREEAIAAAGNVDELMIIGGEAIYRLFLPMANKLYLTFIPEVISGDAYFPKLNWNEWKTISETHSTSHPNLRFLILERQRQ